MLPVIIRQLIIAAVTIVVPFVYSLIANIAPGLPISAGEFLQLVLFVVSAIIGGGAIALASKEFLSAKLDHIQTTALVFWAYTIPAVIYAALIIPAMYLIFAPFN